MSKGLFITATGTDVGKTYITALLVKKLRENSLNAGYYKAVLSGAELVNGVLTAGDANYVCKAIGLQEPANHLVSYLYKAAVSPHLAARIENNPIEMEKVIADFSKIKQKFDFVTVEGSGGIICPLRLDEKTIMLTDVIQKLRLNIVIVAPAELGSINSTVLTVEYAKSQGIGIKGIILNRYDADNFLHVDNQEQISLLTGIPVIACVHEKASDLSIDIATLKSLYEEI